MLGLLPELSHSSDNWRFVKHSGCVPFLVRLLGLGRWFRICCKSSELSGRLVGGDAAFDESSLLQTSSGAQGRSQKTRNVWNSHVFLGELLRPSIGSARSDFGTIELQELLN